MSMLEYLMRTAAGPTLLAVHGGVEGAVRVSSPDGDAKQYSGIVGAITVGDEEEFGRAASREQRVERLTVHIPGHAYVALKSSIEVPMHGGGDWSVERMDGGGAYLQKLELRRVSIMEQSRRNAS